MNPEKLKEEINKAITKHDSSCSCCGPTDIDETTNEVLEVISKLLLSFSQNNEIIKGNE